MGLWPTQGDEKLLLFSKLLSLEAPPSPLSSRPERSAVERSLSGCFFLEMFFDRVQRSGVDLRFSPRCNL
jgi:hypothetical protein